MKKISVEIVRDVCLADNIIIVDGFSGSAKSMLGPIIGSFERVEKQRLELIYEHLCTLYYFDKIDESAATSMMLLYASQSIYDIMISRMVNMRFSDDTSVFKNSHPLKYLKRLFIQDGDAVLKRINTERPILQLTTHQLLGFICLAFKAFGKRLKLIEMERHPLYLIDFWMKKKWGERFGRDPRDFTLWIKREGEVVPAFFVAGEYGNLSPIDRVINSICQMGERNEKVCEELTPDERDRVLFIPFERFVVDPEPYLKLLEQLLGTKRTRSTKNVLRKQRCPRKLVAEDRLQIKKIVERDASQKTLALLESMCRDYERKYGIG